MGYGGYGAQRLYRGYFRVDHHGSGPPALYCLWTFAHRTFRRTHRSRSAVGLIARICSGLFYRVRRGFLLSYPSNGQASGSEGNGVGKRRADPCRRDHACANFTERKGLGLRMLDLPLIWAALIAISILAYVVLDGFDLGIGILYPFLKIGKERDEAMNSVAPVWDGNETWLVLGGGGLFAAFPLAYATILP